MSDVKVLRLSTGEDVVAKVDSGSEKVTLEKPFVIIPQQMGPGKPVQLMMSLYNAFGKGDKVEVAKDKVVFMTDPKDEIKSSYEQNTSKILTPNKGLITERDAKTKLQEHSLKLHKCLPVYKLLDNKGPRHKPLIKVSVKIKNSKNITAIGYSKKEAEQKAAKKLLGILKII